MLKITNRVVLDQKIDKHKKQNSSDYRCKKDVQEKKLIKKKKA